MGEVPVDGFAKAVFKWRGRGKSEKSLRTGGVKASAGLSVGFGGVPADFSAEVHKAGNEVGQVFD